MPTISRRSVILSATAAGIAFGLDRKLEIIPSAFAQAAAHPLNPKGLTSHKFKVGSIEVTTVYDGGILRDHNPAFVKNASVDDVKAALKKAGMPDDKLPNTYTVTIVKVGGKTVMFDAGNAAGRPDVGKLRENAKAAGIDLAKLDAIAVTHFHPDHIFGLMTKENGQIYANTQIIVPENEYKFWADPGVIAKLPKNRQGIAKRVQATMTSWKNLAKGSSGKEIVPGVTAVDTAGHTPGHTSYLVSGGGGQLMVMGDVTNVPAFNLVNPGWHIMFDQDANLAEANRRKLFDRAIADKLVCTGYHWGMPGAGTLAKDGNSYVLKPVA